MGRVQCLPEGLAANAVRAGHRILEAGNRTGLFAFKNGGIEMRLPEHVAEDRQRWLQLVGRGQGTQRYAGAIGIGAAAENGAEVGQLLGDRGFVTFAGTEIKDAARQRCQSGLSRGVEHRAGGKIDLHVEHGQGRGGREVHAGAGGRRPVFDGNTGHCRVCG